MKKRKIDPLEEIMSNPYYQLRDDYNYAEKVKGTISFGQYSMKYWALERDIVLDGTKSEITEERFVKAIMDARKEGEILNDEDEVNGARKIRRKVISHALWLDDDRTLVDEFSTIIKDLVEYDFSIVEEQMKERLNIA